MTQTAYFATSEKPRRARETTRELDGFPRPGLDEPSFFSPVDIIRALTYSTDPLEVRRLQFVIDSTREDY